MNENTIKKVLVVDDAFFMRNMLKGILKKADMEVVAEAQNGIQAIEKYKELFDTENKIDLVLMDITMPDMDGIAALKKIKEFDKNVVVVMCSAMGHQTNVIEALAAGAKDFIVKPFKEHDVIQIIRKALNIEG